MLRRSPQALKVYSLGEFIIPGSKQTRDVIFEMRDIIKSILAHIAAGNAFTHINQKKLSFSS